MGATGDDPSGVDVVAWLWVLVIFVAITACLRGLVACVNADALPTISGGPLDNVGEFITDGFAEAVEQEDTLVMRVMYVAVAACMAVQLGGPELDPSHRWRGRAACLTFVAWRAAAVITCILNSVMDSLLSGRAPHPPGDGKRKSGRRIEKRKSAVAGELAERRAHEMVCNAFTVLVYAMAGVFVFDNLGIEVGGFVSYLGFLGLAFSLGAQYMLQDLLGYSALMVDASVVVGDMVVVGQDAKGSVEAIGYLTTKVRTLDGELLIYRNREFAAARIVNCSRQPHRLVTVHFELAATTAPSDLQVARECAQQAVEDLAGSENKVPESLGGSVRWKDHGVRFYAVWIESLAEGNFRGVSCDLYFMLDGTATKPLEMEAKTLVYIRLAALLEERGLRTQGALVSASLGGGSPSAAAAAAAATARG